MYRSDRPEIVRVGRRQLLGDFPLTSRGLRLPWRGGTIEYGWLALLLCVGLLIPILLAVLVSAPLVFPPLAASSLIIATQSQHLNSHPRAVVLGHGCGILAGLAVSAAAMVWVGGLAYALVKSALFVIINAF